MQITIQTITPEIASEMLAKNTANRPLNQKHVDFLAAQIIAGNFFETGDTIKFCPDGSLLDGQHRLSAVVKSRTSISCAIAKDVAVESFKFIDTGRPRRASDVVSIAGYPQAVNIAACARFILSRNAGAESLVTKGGACYGAEKDFLSNFNMLKFIKENDLMPHVDLAGRWYRMSRLLTSSEYSGYHYLFSKKDADAATAFFEAFSSGTNLLEGSPVLALRRRFEQISSSRVSIATRMRNYFIVTAWNASRTGRSLSKLQYDPSYKMPEIL